MFLHDAVLESLMCGNTQIPVHDFRRCVESLHRWDPSSGLSGFQSQFQVPCHVQCSRPIPIPLIFIQVLEQMSPKPGEVASATARSNKNKNRYSNYLPCKEGGGEGGREGGREGGGEG